VRAPTNPSSRPARRTAVVLGSVRVARANTRVNSGVVALSTPARAELVRCSPQPNRK
jgi:hypothetical protein